LLKFIRSTIPIPILFAFFGFVVFGVVDLLTGRLGSAFIHADRHPALISAFAGTIAGYLIGWYVVQKNGLRHSATAYEVDAAHARRQDAKKP
jgi:hypothetical protein